MEELMLEILSGNDMSLDIIDEWPESKREPFTLHIVNTINLLPPAAVIKIGTKICGAAYGDAIVDSLGGCTIDFSKLPMTIIGDIYAIVNFYYEGKL
jgi:hypothetical protein